jgi:hypothetical protein
VGTVYRRLVGKALLHYRLREGPGPGAVGHAARWACSSVLGDVHSSQVWEADLARSRCAAAGR